MRTFVLTGVLFALLMNLCAVGMSLNNLFVTVNAGNYADWEILKLAVPCAGAAYFTARLIRVIESKDTK